MSQNVLPALRPGETVEGHNAWPGGFDRAVRQRPGGYDMEISIPFARIRGPQHAVASAGDTIRFDTMINDCAEVDGEPSHHHLWSTGNASSRTSGYGVLLLDP